MNPNAVDDDGNSPLHLVLGKRTDTVPEEANEGAKVAGKKNMSTGRIHSALLLAGYGCRVDVANADGVVCHKLALDQGINLTDAAEQWKLRTEPKEAVATLAKDSVLQLPMATGPGHMSWRDKSQFDLCQGCNQAFSFTNRKRHCRRCGHVFCSTCTSKLFTLCPRDASDAPRVSKGK